MEAINQFNFLNDACYNKPLPYGDQFIMRNAKDNESSNAPQMPPPTGYNGNVAAETVYNDAG